MTCPRCRGSGQCIECKGAGSIPCASCEGTGQRQRSAGPAYDCTRCHGTGRETCNPRCDPCLGTGEITDAVQKQIHEKYTMRGTPVEDALGFRMFAALLVLNCAAFVAERSVPGFQQSFEFFGPDAVGGQWWRFLTAQFVHYGFIHIGMNMMFLIYYAPTVERLVGPWRLLGLYLSTGAGGYALSYWMDPLTITAGASASLFGLAGVLLGLQWRYRLFDPSGMSQFTLWLVGWIALGFLAPGLHLNNWAHLGGGLTGLALGSAIRSVNPR